MIQKTIADFISGSPPPAVSPADTVESAVAVMRERKSDCVLVLDDQKLVGIFTERDFLNRVTASKRRPSETPVAEVMTADPSTLGSSDCISYAINRMAVGGYRNIPIISDEGRPVSVLTVRDVMSHLHELFDEVEGDERARDDWNEWTDIGGG